jgi:hypothetical protein
MKKSQTNTNSQSTEPSASELRSENLIFLVSVRPLKESHSGGAR